MKESIDNTEIFDPNLEPLSEPIAIPDNEPFFLTELTISSAAGKDPLLRQIKATQLMLGIQFVDGEITPDDFVNTYDSLSRDIKSYIEHKTLPNQE